MEFNAYFLRRTGSKTLFTGKDLVAMPYRFVKELFDLVLGFFVICWEDVNEGCLFRTMVVVTFYFDSFSFYAISSSYAVGGLNSFVIFELEALPLELLNFWPSSSTTVVDFWGALKCSKVRRYYLASTAILCKSWL